MHNREQWNIIVCFRMYYASQNKLSEIKINIILKHQLIQLFCRIKEFQNIVTLNIYKLSPCHFHINRTLSMLLSVCAGLCVAQSFFSYYMFCGSSFSFLPWHFQFVIELLILKILLGVYRLFFKDIYVLFLVTNFL